MTDPGFEPTPTYLTPGFEPTPTHLTLASRSLNTGETEKSDLEIYKGKLVE